MIRNVTLVIAALSVAGVAMLGHATYPDCHYTMSFTPNGQACNALTAPPPETAVEIGICAYDWCDHAQKCAQNKTEFQQKRRVRACFEWTNPQPPHNVVYYTDAFPSDANDGCCLCNTHYDNVSEP